MFKQSCSRLFSFLLFASFAVFSNVTYADLTFQASDAGGGKTLLTVVSASGAAIDSSNDAYFYGFGQIVPWDGLLTVQADSVSGTIAGSTLQPNQFFMNASSFDNTQTGWQIALSSNAGSLVGSNASIRFPISPTNFTTQYTLNPAFGSGNLGVITILPVQNFLPVNTAPVPLNITVVMVMLLGLTGLYYSRRKSRINRSV